MESDLVTINAALVNIRIKTNQNKKTQ
jgi:hypothetical protein